VIRYEDIVRNSSALDRLAEYLALDLDREILKKRIGARDGKRSSPTMVASRRRCMHGERQLCAFRYALSGEVSERCETP